MSLNKKSNLAKILNYELIIVKYKIFPRNFYML